ncbi:MAG: GNAT family N-acetyltransferase, partial [Lactococcus lactis]|nr:GNAT family N-acetyltransferase [Lactococcus lactis]
PKIQHIGFTTWSGNQGMMRLGEKSGLKLDGQIRKVRYWQETWYDSIKYGILREELKK